MYDGESPLPWYAVFRVFRRHTVRKGSVLRTQKTCYIVRRHQLTLNISHVRFVRDYIGHFI